VVELLLLAGASPDKRDALGSTALLEAAKAGQDRCVDLLLKHNAALGLSTIEAAARLCECTANSDLPQLRWVVAGLQ
jgi:ankyrin repeat protein